MKNQKLPDAFMNRIKKILPEDEWADFFETCTEPMPKTVRFIQPTDGTLPSTDNNWQLSPAAELPHTFFIDRTDRTVSLGKTMQHYSGKMYIASLSSLLSAHLLDAQSEEKILDLCLKKYPRPHN